jgi:hypothetical protein
MPLWAGLHQADAARPGICMLVAAFIGLLVAYYLYRRKQRISSSAAGN